jgi:bifunctional non-homologous end joining protein LigD
VLDGPAGLRSLVQQGVLEIHGWMARAERIDRPDRLVLDLDPAPDVPFSAVVDAARLLRRRLASLGLVSFPATTGGKGLHLHVPLDGSDGWDEAKGFARAFAEALVAEAPERFVASASKALRKGRIFVDWLRNGRGATAVVPYSTRARPGAPVATPLAWSEVGPRLSPARWTVLSVPRRVARGRDPWASWGRTRQRLPRTAPTSSARRGTPAPAARSRSRPRRTA